MGIFVLPSGSLMKGIMMDLQFNGGAKWLLGCGLVFITISELIFSCSYLYRFPSSGLVSAICLACENQVCKTELRLKMFYMVSTSGSVPGGGGLSFLGTILQVAEGVYF